MEAEISENTIFSLLRENNNLTKIQFQAGFILESDKNILRLDIGDGCPTF
jgi:hypothetical protein